MKPIAIKPQVPLIFFILVSVWWGFYYQSHGWLNDFGQANFEWLYLLDGLIMVPILCFICIKDKKEAALKALVLASLAVFIGSLIIPEQNKWIWHTLEKGRYFVLAGVLALEIIALLTVYLTIKAALNKSQDADVAIQNAVQGLLGDGVFSRFLSFEIRMWTFALFSKNITASNYQGQQHFSYHLKGGTQSNLLGFILMIAFEIPLMHLVLHFVWSPWAANVVSLLTLFSLVFLVAEYRATSKRPISLTNKSLIIRYGIFQPLSLPLNNIKSVKRVDEPIERQKGLKKYNYFGSPNIEITLNEAQLGCKKIYIGLDAPDAFVNAINAVEVKSLMTLAK